ncbi:MAG: B12-binding domain-containing radical SAM protein [Syntrophobacteria bacterium]
MQKKGPHILLINPWIYDFAAHDLWAKPLGLLLLAGVLRFHGYRLRLVDCLDVYDPRMRQIPGTRPATRRAFGTGKFYRTPVDKPPALSHVHRTYWRFGITPELFVERVLAGERPDVVLVTSGMTYWYPGVHECIRMVKEHFPRAPVVLGGVYASLCREHAIRYSGADCVVAGPGERCIPELVEKLTGRTRRKPVREEQPETLPWPAFELLDNFDYVCVLTSRGCPFRCPYCASALLYPDFVQRDPLRVADELHYWHETHGIVDVAFYDDALLLHARNHILPLLAEVQRRRLPLRFHTPNAVHLSALDADVCQVLSSSGFKTLRLGLETADPGLQHTLGAKVKPGVLSAAMANLANAGFAPEHIGVYLLCGLPGQDPVEVATSIRVVRDHGARPHLAEYSPIPGTRIWQEALRCSAYDLAGEPLYHNNSLLPCRSERFGQEELQWLKQLCRKGIDNADTGTHLGGRRGSSE